MISLKLKKTAPQPFASGVAEPDASSAPAHTTASAERRHRSSSSRASTTPASSTRRHNRARRHSTGSSNRRHRSSGRVPNKNHTPPASKAAIENLLHLRLRAEDPKSLNDACPNEECVICAECFSDKDVVTTLPCGHMHHSDCIVDWLSRKCTCPTCRYEMPTDDKSFERRRARRAAKDGAEKQRIAECTSSEDDESKTPTSKGLLILQGLDMVAMKRNEYLAFRKYDNFDLIVRRTLRMKQDVERKYALAAGISAPRSRGTHDEEASTDADIHTDPIDHAHFLELYAGRH